MNQSTDREKQTSNFLSELFHRLIEEKFTYCILRNYEDLPEKAGNDVDIWVKNSDSERFRQILHECAEKNGWELIRYSARPSFHGEGDYFYLKNSNGLSIIHMDCWTDLYWRGISYIDESILAENLHSHERGFYIPAPGVEAGILLLKDLIYHKKVKDKYTQKILDYIKEDSQSFLDVLKKPFSRKTAGLILDRAKAGMWHELEQKCNFLRWTLFKRALLYKTLLQLRHWLAYFYGHLKKFLFPNLGLFVVLIGPDGSGKSTTANLLLESEIKKLFQKKIYFHGHFFYLPELKKIVSFLHGSRNESVNKKGNTVAPLKPFGVLRAMLYPLYYGLDYFLGHVFMWKERARGGFILFDRYFYDYMIQKLYDNCPRWVLSFIARIIPQPDLLIYLKNSPEIIHRRKSELTVDEIERQSKICREITARFNNSFTISTSKSPEKVVEDIQRIIVERIKEKQKINIQ